MSASERRLAALALASGTGPCGSASARSAACPCCARTWWPPWPLPLPGCWS